MLPDTAFSFRASRPFLSRPFFTRTAPQRYRLETPVQLESATTQWLIRDNALIGPHGQKFRVARHGIVKYEAIRLADECRVIYGEFPNLADITDDDERLEDALSQVAPSGDLFSVYASVYRNHQQSVLLLDYLT